MNDKSDQVLLQIRNLRIQAQHHETWTDILHDINLTLHRGQVIGLIGESGAGKSTLGLAAMGFIRDRCRVTQGEINYKGTDLVNASKRDLNALRGTKIAYVAQSASASFNPAHRLIDQHTEVSVDSGTMSRQESEMDAVNLYRQLRLSNPEEIGFRYPHQVSGGQLQRMMTAMAMSCRPELIIFDEPTTALDMTTQIEVLAAIRQMVKRYNTAAIYITHDLAVVAQMADEIKVLLNGTEVEQAKTQTMLDEPKHEYTKSLWAVRRFERKQSVEIADDQAPLIEVNQIHASYDGNVDILNGVSFNIHKGSTTAIVGESGSGKSTIARVITGLLPSSSGVVNFKGDALPALYDRRSKEQLRQIQMIYQMADTALNPKSTISEILARPAEFYHQLKGPQLKRRVEELLDLIGLDAKAHYHRYPHELSGGQKQRVGIARALAADPAFIICDEVISALDQIVAEGVLRLLDDLQRELGLAYMFITHDLTTVQSMADYVVVMHKGHVVNQGTREDVFNPPHHPYTHKLISSKPTMNVNWLTNVLEQRAQSNVSDTDLRHA